MNNRKLITHLLGLVWVSATLASPDDAPRHLELTDYQTAVLDPAQWDTVIPNALYFDALRPMLVRFPGLAQKVDAELEQGYEVEKMELVLEWQNQESARPERGRSGWGADKQYTLDPAKWHVEARALRRPWSVEVPQQGPTFLAWVNGVAFWERAGARGGQADLTSAVFGPAPLFPNSNGVQPVNPPRKKKTAARTDPVENLRPATPSPLDTNSIARLDVTRTLTDTDAGTTLGDRLRRLEACGFAVRKHELFNMQYKTTGNGYDWAVSTGYMKIWVKPPRLVVSFRKGSAPGLALPPELSAVRLADDLKARGANGTPGVFVPPALAALAAEHLKRPAGIPDWEWQRIQELRALAPDPKDVALALGHGFNFNALWCGDRDTYLAAMSEILRLPPRHWFGHPTTTVALLPVACGDMLPPAVLDHLALYWSAWLHPDVSNRKDIGGNQGGVPSYFRGYDDGGGTMNFGHNAVSGALLAAQFIHSPVVLKEATAGVEHLQREWGLASGAHQEIGDTYYQAITLAATGVIALYAEDPVTRLLGRLHRDRLIEPLISMYHPGLRRMTHPMGRGPMAYHLLLQEGPYHILHTLSPAGALMHLADLTPERKGTPTTWGKVHDLAILGDEAPPDRIGFLAPWTDSYLSDTMAAMVDDKALPCRVFARDFSPGCHAGGWHVNYLGRNFALASRDNANENYGKTSIVAQWRRTPRPVARLDDLSTLLMTFGEDAHFPTSGSALGDFGIVQHGGKLMALKGLPPRERLEESKETRHAIQTTIGIIAFGEVKDREVWLNGKKLDALSGAHGDPGGNWEQRLVTGLSAGLPAPPPVRADEARATPAAESPRLQYPPSTNRTVVEARDGDVITLRDGETFVGVIPMTVNALKRNIQVELTFEHPTLMIHAYVYRDVSGLNLDDYYGASRKPTAGFALEVADASEYPSFEAFRTHMSEVKLQARWNASSNLAEVTYVSGADRLEMGYDPSHYPAVYRRVNGQWPYLPEGIMRESSWAIQGSTGHIAKNGALLRSEPGHHAYLEAVPATDMYIGYNPLPDPMNWSLTVPTGTGPAWRIIADGKAGLMRVAACPKQDHIWIDYAVKPAQTGIDMATSLVVMGPTTAPRVSVNDGILAAMPAPMTLEGQHAFIIPLPGAPTVAGTVAERLAKVTQAWHQADTK